MVKIYINKTKAKLNYCVAWRNPETGQRERRTFVQLAEAEKQVLDTQQYLTTVEKIRTKLSSIEITNFAIQQKRLGETSINEAVDYYLQNFKKEKTTPLYRDMAYEYIIEKKKQTNLNKTYIENLENYLLKSCDTFTGEIGKITREEVQKFLDDNWVHPVTKNNVRRTLIGLFRWAKYTKHCLAGDYQTAAELVPLLRVDPTNPEIYSPEDLQKILETARNIEPQIIPFIAIAAFTGIRNAEICRLNFDKINWEEKIIPLSPEITKTKHRRLVPMEDVLIAWLKISALEGKVVPYNNVHVPLSKVLLASGVKSKRNGFRHSYCSYSLAFQNNPALTAQICGHSPAMLESTYKSIQLDDGRFITRELAQKYFSIYP